ncbi:hypothetical protein NVP1170O_034 [Vibrio phage 1.170.O._10N.261.52.C3]|nr:hypothetical protein NVP1170O_034 [Vibrio phage 1.170.O._10N.261.52.C3]
MKKYRMRVWIFKPSGKFYDGTIFETDLMWMHQIVEEFRAEQATSSYYFVITGKLEDGSDHPNGYPCLVKF